MTNFNYTEAVTADVIDFIRDEVNASDYENRESLSEFLNDELWCCDSVTGNASGSYTFNAYKAKEFIFTDPDTVSEALREFCVDAETIAEKFLSQDWEYFDVTARCYVLSQAIEAALDSLENELSFSEEE
jgi:hypothetical protein